MEPEVKASKVLLRDNQLDSGKYDVPASNKFSSSEGHSDVTPQDLSWIWGISLRISSIPLMNNTQTFLCNAILPLSRRYGTDQVLAINNLLVEWLMDKMDGRGFSLEVKKCAQVFLNKGYVSCVYPMDSKNKLGDTFLYICQGFGVPEKLTFNGS